MDKYFSLLEIRVLTENMLRNSLAQTFKESSSFCCDAIFSLLLLKFLFVCSVLAVVSFVIAKFSLSLNI